MATRAHYLFGLLVTVAGLLNVLPTYDLLPRIGPFELSWFRPFIYWACMCAVLLGLQVAQNTRTNGCINITLAIILTIICFDSYRVGVLLEESVFFFGQSEFVISLAALSLCVFISWRVWGYPIAILGTIAGTYLLLGQYLPEPLATGPADIFELAAGNLWYSIDQGILGNILGIVSTTVLPFIVLGAVLDGVGAGGSMIRIAFFFMSRFRGGPAYAAVASSALFGTVSGSAVANVVGTGVVTIPMIKKKGFSNEFSGAVEAAASTGGQILPPIMGAAALVMADIVGVSYITVMLAALIPALAYYASLFMTIGFEASRLDIEGDADEADPPVSQDWINLLLVFGPVVVIVALLLKGMSPAGASISAIVLLLPMSLINPEIRKSPKLLIHALSNGGNTVSRLISVTAVVGVVVATLAATGLPSKISVLLLDAASSSLLLALLISAVGCIVLGMGMPTLPAYIAIISVMGSTFQNLGLELLVAHLFVFTYGVASVITPPVAIASYAAASIAEGTPIRTAVQSSRVGAMIFLIPFAFVFNPSLTFNGGQGVTSLADLAVSVGFLFVAMYLVGRSLIGFDRRTLHPIERLFGVCLGLLLISGEFKVQVLALIVGLLLISARYIFPQVDRVKEHVNDV